MASRLPSNFVQCTSHAHAIISFQSQCCSAKRSKSLTNDGRAEPQLKVRISLWLELWKNEIEISLTSESLANRSKSPPPYPRANPFFGGRLSVCLLSILITNVNNDFSAIPWMCEMCDDVSFESGALAPTADQIEGVEWAGLEPLGALINVTRCNNSWGHTRVSFHGCLHSAAHSLGLRYTRRGF